MSVSGRGIAMSLVASLLFSSMPVYFIYLKPLSSMDILVQRIIWSIPAVLAIFLFGRRFRLLVEAWQRLRTNPFFFLGLVFCALMIGIQQGLFIWAPLSGETLGLSLGYFLLPLVMVVIGRVFYGERLRPLQLLAVLLALFGVAHELWIIGGLPWVALLVALGYPPYLMIRRWMQLDALSGYLLEMLLLLPIAIAFIWHSNPLSAMEARPLLWALLPGLGLLTAVAFAAMLAASRILPFGLFGILTYIEPLLIFLCAVTILHEPLAAAQLLTYVPIWLSISLMMMDGVLDSVVTRYTITEN